MMDEFSKPSKKGSILAVACYVFAVALLITAFVSLAACHQNISRQLEQGVPVQGNELAIVNLYFTEEVEPEEDDDDWEGWEFREQDK